MGGASVEALVQEKCGVLEAARLTSQSRPLSFTPRTLTVIPGVWKGMQTVESIWRACRSGALCFVRHRDRRNPGTSACFSDGQFTTTNFFHSCVVANFLMLISACFQHAAGAASRPYQKLHSYTSSNAACVQMRPIVDQSSPRLWSYLSNGDHRRASAKTIINIFR
jgi:hypothetical protein